MKSSGYESERVTGTLTKADGIIRVQQEKLRLESTGVYHAGSYPMATVIPSAPASYVSESRSLAVLREDIARLSQEIEALRSEIARIIGVISPAVSIAVITTFAPEPYRPIKPIIVSIQRTDDECTASFFDANIYTTGDNEHEAFDNIKSLILDFYDLLMKEDQERLGPEPRRQRDVLTQYIEEIS